MLSKGSLIDHIHLKVGDFERSRDFYCALFEALGIEDSVHGGRDWLEVGELLIEQAGPHEQVSRVHLAFAAPDRDAVQRFHAAGLATGGKDNGPPGPRDYHPGYFSAYLLDPDGNNVEAKLNENR